MKSYTTLKVEVSIHDIVEQFSVDDMVDAYGKSEVIRCFTLNDIVSHHEAFHEMLLQAIGDDKVAAYYEEYIAKKDGAA